MKPSLRSKLISGFIKVGVKPFLGPQTDLQKLRKFANGATRFVMLPKNTHVENISADGVPSEWVFVDGVNQKNVVIYFHGGGYNWGSCNTHRELAARLSLVSDARVLLVDYRLAPEHPYPAALDDAISAYQWLLDEGFAANNIVIAGDSAGGGLTLSTAVSLRDKNIPLPAALVCLSPWADLEMSSDTMISNDRIDPMLNNASLSFWAKNYIASDQGSNPLISPIHADLHGLPPLFIQAGEREVLLGDALLIKENAQAAGVDVTLDVWPDMWHVWQAMARVVPEAQQAINELGVFINKQLNLEPQVLKSSLN